MGGGNKWINFCLLTSGKTTDFPQNKNDVVHSIALPLCRIKLTKKINEGM